MGAGLYSSAVYSEKSLLRSATKTPDFEYQEKSTPETTVHTTLDPKRILDKPFKKLESRDSIEHPNSLPVVINFDVTGSNRSNAKVAQKKLCELMDGLALLVDDPQVAMWANDDARFNPTIDKKAAMQMSDFESDNRVDDHLRNMLLVGFGGGNDGESYDLVIYALARKTVSDSLESRGEKGYAFLYADEPFFWTTEPLDVKTVFGDVIPKAIRIEDLIKEAREAWVIYVLWPTSGYTRAREQYVKLFGEEFVISLESPNNIVEAILDRVKLDVEKKKLLAL